MKEYNKDFLEYCEVMNITPNTRDQIIFMAGMTFQSLKQTKPEKEDSSDISI